MIVRPIDDVRPHGLPHIRFADPASLVGRVKELGGQVALAPDETIRRGTVAILLDPSGAAVALQKWGETFFIKKRDTIAIKIVKFYRLSILSSCCDAEHANKIHFLS